jgi:ribosomal protein S18 acetylase RimI-like enzyme
LRAFAIVKAETRDFAEISAVDADAWGGDPCMVDGQYAWRVFVEHTHVWVARCLNSEKIVGAVLLLPTSQQQHYFVHKLFVDRGFFRSGIGSALMAAACFFLDKLGATAELTVAADDWILWKIFINHDFSEKEAVPNYYGDGKTEISMTRSVHDHPINHPGYEM